MSLYIKKPTRELSIGEIINQSFNLYSVRFVYFFIPFLFAGLMNGTFNMVVYTYFPLPQPPFEYTSPEELMSWLGSFIAAVIVVAALIGIVGWIVTTIINGVAIKYSSDLLEKGDANLFEGLNFTVTRLVSLLVVGVITGVLIIIGLICLIVPGIIIAIMFALVTPAIIIERVGALESLERSRRLVSHRWGKTFVVFLLISIIFGIISALANTVLSPLGPASSIITNLIEALIQPVLPIALTFLYYSMTAKEAQLAPTPSVPPAPVPTTTPLKFCSQCGYQIPFEAKFCPHCGKEIK